MSLPEQEGSILSKTRLLRRHQKYQGCPEDCSIGADVGAGRKCGVGLHALLKKKVQGDHLYQPLSQKKMLPSQNMALRSTHQTGTKHIHAGVLVLTTWEDSKQPTKASRLPENDQLI